MGRQGTESRLRAASHKETGTTMQRVAVGSRVRIVWPSTHDGLTGVVTAIDGTNDTLYVRIDGERWRTMAPILLAREEVVPADTEESE